MITNVSIGDLIYIKPKTKLRCWQSGCNLVKEVRFWGKKGDFWITCFNPSMKQRKYHGNLPCKHYEFLVYKNQFVRSVQAGSILIFKKKSI